MSEPFDPYYLWLGIPPEESVGGGPNHYRLLGLRLFEPNREVISYAVDQRSSHLRSFQAGKRGAESQRLLNEVAAAGVCLLDEDKKRAYDRQLLANLKIPAAGFAARPIAESAPPEPPVSRAEPTFSAAVAPPPRADGSESLEWSSGPQVVTIDSPEVGEAAPAPEEWPEEAPSAAGPPKLALTVGAVAGALALLSIAAVVVGLVASAPDSGTGEELPGPRVAAGTPHKAPIPNESGPAESRPGESKPAVATHGETNPVVTSVVPPTTPVTLPPAGVSNTPLPPPSAAVPSFSPRAHAIVFRGRETVHVPIPDELRTMSADFTIEAWIRCDRARPAGRIMSTTGSGAIFLESRDRMIVTGGVSTVLVFGAPKLGSRPAPVPAAHWIHVALVRDGPTVRWFVDGAPQTPFTEKAYFVFDDEHLVLGDSANGFCGLVREVRISRGALYRQPFKPPHKFNLAGDTLVSLRMSPGAENRVEDDAGGDHVSLTSGIRWLPLTGDGQVAAETRSGTVDLLRAFDLETGRLEGHPRLDSQGLDMGTRSGRTRIVIPYPAPAEYDLTAQFVRPYTTGGPILGLSIAGRPAVVALNAFPRTGDRTGILPADMSSVATCPTMQGQPLSSLPGEPTTVEVKVRLQNTTGYNVEIWQNGRPLTGSIGGLNRELGVPSEFVWPCDGCFMVGSVDCPVRFTELTLTPVTADLPEGIELARSEPAATPPTDTLPIPVPGPNPTNSSPPVTTPAVTPEVKPAAPSGKRSLPPAAELAAKTEEAWKLYEAEIKEAARPEEKKSLAARIQRQAEATKTWTDRYVLLDLARKVYVMAGAVDDALLAAAAIEAEYEIPRNEMVLATMDALDGVSLPLLARVQLTRAARDLAEQLVEGQAYAQAEKAANLALQSANRQSDVQLRKQIGEQRMRIARIAREYAAVRPHLDTLTTSPTDKAANLAAGRFYCLVLEDWPRGLPLLEASGDAVFAGPARLDRETRAAGATAVDELKAGETWLQVAATTSAGDREDRRAIQRRAKMLLEAALPNLSGLERIRGEKKLQALPDLGPARRTSASTETAPAAAPAPAPAAAAAPAAATARKPADELRGPRLIGSISRAGIDTGVLVQYPLGYRMTLDDARLLGRTVAGRGEGRAGGELSLSLQGEVSLPAPQELTFSLFGAPANGGVNAVIVDDAMALVIREDEGTENHRTMTLAEGKHTIRWVMTGGYIAPGGLEIKPSGQATRAAPAVLPPDRLRTVVLQQQQAGNVVTLGRSP
jgi:hypothetical protein